MRCFLTDPLESVAFGLCGKQEPNFVQPEGRSTAQAGMAAKMGSASTEKNPRGAWAN